MLVVVCKLTPYRPERRVVRDRLPVCGDGTCARAGMKGSASSFDKCRIATSPLSYRACPGCALSGCNDSRRIGGTTDTSHRPFYNSNLHDSVNLILLLLKKKCLPC